MRLFKYVILGFLLVIFSYANAFAAVDIVLNGPSSNVAQSKAFDVTVDMTGTDTVGAVTLTVNFDNTLVQIAEITTTIDGAVAPTNMDNVNTNGSFSIPYASTTGFVPGDLTTYATVSAESQTTDGDASFTIDTTSNIKTAVFPPQDITGNFTNLAVTIGGDLNTAPTVSDVVLSTATGTAVNGNFDGQDVDSNSLTYTIATQPSNGTVVNNNDGTFTYTPSGTFTGTDSFTYKANDGTADSATAATVSITVADNTAPTAGNVTLTTSLDTAAAGNFDGQDADGDTLTYAIATQPSNGEVAINTGGTSFTYTPSTGFTGSDTFTYTASDGAATSAAATVTITVSDVLPPGDGDGNGTVDIFDALAAALYDAEMGTPANLDQLDVVCPLGVDINDALQIAKYDAGLVTELTVVTSCP